MQSKLCQKSYDNFWCSALHKGIPQGHIKGFHTRLIRTCSVNSLLLKTALYFAFIHYEFPINKGIKGFNIKLCEGSHKTRCPVMVCGKFNPFLFQNF